MRVGMGPGGGEGGSSVTCHSDCRLECPRPSCPSPPHQVCAAITTAAASVDPATITFSLGAGNLATVTLPAGAGTATVDAGSGTLAGATLEGATIADIKAITDLCLVITSAGNIDAVNAPGTHTLTVGGTLTGGGALSTATASLTVSKQQM